MSGALFQGVVQFAGRMNFHKDLGAHESTGIEEGFEVSSHDASYEKYTCGTMLKRLRDLRRDTIVRAGPAMQKSDELVGS